MLHFEFEEGPLEHLIVVRGTHLRELALALFGRPLIDSRLEYLSWDATAPPAACCYYPPDRLEVRIPARDGWAAAFDARLRSLQTPTPDSSRAPDFVDLVLAVIRRIEAWDYGDADLGTGGTELAAAIAGLRADAPTAAARRDIDAARDALDDGLPADAIIAPLYRAAAARGPDHPGGGR